MVHQRQLFVLASRNYVTKAQALHIFYKKEKHLGSRELGISSGLKKTDLNNLSIDLQKPKKVFSNLECAF